MDKKKTGGKGPTDSDRKVVPEAGQARWTKQTDERIRIIVVDVGTIAMGSEGGTSACTFAAAGLDVAEETVTRIGATNAGTEQRATTQDFRKVSDWIREAVDASVPLVLAAEAPMWATTDWQRPEGKSVKFERGRFPEEEEGSKQWYQGSGAQGALRAAHTLARILERTGVVPSMLDILDVSRPLTGGRVYLCEGFATDAGTCGRFKPGDTVALALPDGQRIAEVVGNADEADALACAAAIADGILRSYLNIESQSFTITESANNAGTPLCLWSQQNQRCVLKSSRKVSHWANMLVAAYSTGAGGWEFATGSRVTNDEIGAAALRVAGPCPVFGTRF